MNQVIREIDGSVTGPQLIKRYNTAPAQAMLYRATRMIIDVYDSYRSVFKYIKLARLMHSIKPHGAGYRIEVDGPVSLFSNVERYGIAMAKLLPAVLKCKEWRLAAKSSSGFRREPGLSRTIETSRSSTPPPKRRSTRSSAGIRRASGE